MEAGGTFMVICTNAIDLNLLCELQTILGVIYGPDVRTWTLTINTGFCQFNHHPNGPGTSARQLEDFDGPADALDWAEEMLRRTKVLEENV